MEFFCPLPLYFKLKGNVQECIALFTFNIAMHHRIKLNIFVYANSMDV